MNNIKTRNIAYGALFIAIVTGFTFINIPIFPQGGLLHLGYIALFPIAVVFGKRYGLIAGAFGMALFDVLSQWFAWAPATFIIVGIVGYVVGFIADGGSSYLRIVVALIVGSIISVSGYFVFNAFIMGFGVPSALTSAGGDSLKLVVSVIVSIPVIPALLEVKQRFVK